MEIWTKQVDALMRCAELDAVGSFDARAIGLPIQLDGDEVGTVCTSTPAERFTVSTREAA